MNAKTTTTKNKQIANNFMLDAQTDNTKPQSVISAKKLKARNINLLGLVTW